MCVHKERHICCSSYKFSLFLSFGPVLFIFKRADACVRESYISYFQKKKKYLSLLHDRDETAFTSAQFTYPFRTVDFVYCSPNKFAVFEDFFSRNLAPFFGLQTYLGVHEVHMVTYFGQRAYFVLMCACTFTRVSLSFFPPSPPPCVQGPSSLSRLLCLSGNCCTHGAIIDGETVHRRRKKTPQTRFLGGFFFFFKLIP